VPGARCVEYGAWSMEQRTIEVEVNVEEVEVE
jgi:hypothetical protein